MKETITNTWCDTHASRGEEVHGLTMRVTIDDEGPLEIDLCAECITELVDPLRKTIATFGQPVTDGPRRRARKQASAPAPTPAKKSSSSRSSRAKSAKVSPAEVRAWAIENGHELPNRGRIPQDIQQAYDEAHTKKA